MSGAEDISTSDSTSHESEDGAVIPMSLNGKANVALLEATIVPY